MTILNASRPCTCIRVMYFQTPCDVVLFARGVLLTRRRPNGRLFLSVARFQVAGAAVTFF